MKIKNKKSFSFKKLLIPMIVLLIGIGVYAYALSNNYFYVNKSASDSQSLPESPNDPVPDTPVNPTDNSGKESLSDEPSAPSIDSPEIILTAVTVNGDTLQARALIQGVVSNGSCTLLVKRGSENLISETAATQPGPSTSTCRGFDVPLNSVENGTISVSISYTINGTTKFSQATELTLSR